MSFERYLLLVALILISSKGYTTEIGKPSSSQVFIDSKLFSPSIILPPAPFLDQFKGKSELIEVKTLVMNATQNEHELAIKDAKTKNVSFFGDTVQGFDIGKLPKTKALFNKVDLIQSYEAEKFKVHFSRKRPHLSDPTIKTCVSIKEAGNFTSYPSGHATMGFSMGVILAYLIPEKSQSIMSRANLYAENRLICGVHHRSDIVAGQVLGTLVAVELLKNHEFQTMLRAAKKELFDAGLTKEL